MSALFDEGFEVQASVIQTAENRKLKVRETNLSRFCVVALARVRRHWKSRLVQAPLILAKTPPP